MSKDYETYLKLFSSLKKPFSAVGRALKRAAGCISLIGPRLRFGRSAFRRANTDLTYGALKKDRGRFGEYLLFDKLRRAGGKWLFNVYLPKGDEKTEIDSILISGRGVFLFESKNFTGRIYGEITQREWFHTFRTRAGVKKQRFFNPLMQNSAHKNAFTALFETELPVYPVVVFGKRSELRTPAAKTKRDELMKIGDLPGFVKSKRKTGAEIAEIERLYEAIRPYTVVTSYEKYKHIKSVTKKQL